MKKTLYSNCKNFYRLTFLACLILLFLIHFNCQTKNIEEQKASGSAITIGTGGGFTGIFEGYSFYSNGIVEYWQRYPSGNDSVYWTSKINPFQFDSLQQWLIQSGMLGENIDEKGNMTYMATYSTPDTTHYWSWNEQSEIPVKFRRWYNEAFQFFERMRKKE